MSRIVAVGEKHFVAAFACVGAELVPCATAAEFERTLVELRRDQSVGLVLAEESLAAGSPAAVDEFKEVSAATFVALQSRVSDRHAALDWMRQLIEKSTGANLLGEY